MPNPVVLGKVQERVDGVESPPELFRCIGKHVTVSLAP
jgi:hypothetical protein